MMHHSVREDVIVDPRAFLSVAPPASPLWALVDSFDAAANGMTNPDAFSRLSDIDEEAFRPWKALVAALGSLYNDDPGSLSDAVDRIPEDSPPAVLKPLFLAWAAAPEESASDLLADAPAAVAALYRRVVVDSHPAESVAEQAEEALRQGMVDHFEALACRVLRELHENNRVDGPLLALRYVARCLSLLDDSEAEAENFFPAVLRTIGRADGLVALGLALIGRDDKAAAAAFRGALGAAGQKGFLDADMRMVIAAAADILENRDAKADTRRRERPVKRKASGIPQGQLDLFSGEGA